MKTKTKYQIGRDNTRFRLGIGVPDFQQLQLVVIKRRNKKKTCTMVAASIFRTIKVLTLMIWVNSPDSLAQVYIEKSSISTACRNTICRDHFSDVRENKTIRANSTRNVCLLFLRAFSMFFFDFTRCAGVNAIAANQFQNVVTIIFLLLF